MQENLRQPRKGDAQFFDMRDFKDKLPQTETRHGSSNVERGGATRAAEAREAHQRAHEREAARKNVETSTSIPEIVEGWRVMQERGDTMRLTREQLRTIDMHVACNDRIVLDRVRRNDSALADLLDTLDRTTPGSAREPNFTPRLEEGISPFDFLRNQSAAHGKEIVEQGADERTEREHRRMRLGVDVAVHTERIEDFLHVLDAQIGRCNAEKLTALERAHLHDQLAHLLQSRDWPHPTQELAHAFTAWEKTLGTASMSRLTIVTDIARFKKESPAGNQQRVPTLLENLRNAPADIGKFIFNENGARTGKK